MKTNELASGANTNAAPVVNKRNNKKVSDDEQQILNKVTTPEPVIQEEEMSLDELITQIQNEAASTKEVAWFMSIPKKERLLAGDIVYHEELERFGIVVRPAKKEGLMRLRLLKLGAKNQVYTRDWFLDFDDITLVKRGNSIKRGFSETDEEFLVRPSRKSEVAATAN